jgi:2-dehydropantoate 2-reductase
MNKENPIAILGAGAIGGFLAALFWKNNIPVTCVVKPNRVNMLITNGIQLDSKKFGKFVAHPSVVEILDAECSVLFVCTKSIGLVEALDRIPLQFIKKGIIVPLLNGIEHMDVLRPKFGNCVVAGSIGKLDVKLVGESKIVHSTISGTINVASDHDISRNRLRSLVKQIQEIGLNANFLEREADVLWPKLIRLNALACTTTASGMLLGEIRSDPYWRKAILDCVSEACLVAELFDYYVAPQDVMNEIDLLPDNIGTSMQRDVQAGRPSELDAIAGAIVRAGQERGVLCPRIEKMINIISQIQTYVN